MPRTQQNKYFVAFGVKMCYNNLKSFAEVTFHAAIQRLPTGFKGISDLP